MATPVSMSSGKKREAMDAYLLISRSNEELALLEKEISNVVHYYEDRENIITDKLALPPLNQFERGKKALLHILLQQNTDLLMQICQVQYHILHPTASRVQGDTLTSDSESCSYDDVTT